MSAQQKNLLSTKSGNGSSIKPSVLGDKLNNNLMNNKPGIIETEYVPEKTNKNPNFKYMP